MHNINDLTSDKIDDFRSILSDVVRKNIDDTNYISDIYYYILYNTMEQIYVQIRRRYVFQVDSIVYHEISTHKQYRRDI